MFHLQTPDLLENSVESLKLSETVVERDIRIQQERERALVIERQKALKSAEDKVAKSPSSREKEEELQPQMGTTQHPDEAYLSIPTTDEGNFSEYGSEDKEDHSPDGRWDTQFLYLYLKTKTCFNKFKIVSV